MRTLRIVLLLVSPALTGGAMLAAQAVERTDVPARGVLRVTFDPRIMTWNDEFTDAGRLKLGAPLTGDTVGGRYIPVVASLGAGLFNVRQERRTYPTTAELGITKRLSVSLMVPMVRVQTRASLQLSNRGANLGVNPLVVNTLGVRGKDSAFFAQFDSALVRLDQQAAGWALPPSPCAAHIPPPAGRVAPARSRIARRTPSPSRVPPACSPPAGSRRGWHLGSKAAARPASARGPSGP